MWACECGVSMIIWERKGERVDWTGVYSAVAEVVSGDGEGFVEDSAAELAAKTESG